ncbi:MAG: glycosyltransferase [Lachnospiraceae bacterium]|nr:glycosyltransferase [Lachnospiraceae bacterium]
MGKIKNIYSRIYTPVVKETGRIFFYMALLFEVVILMLDKCDWVNPYQSMMFRVTFILFLVKCICTEYTPKEWIFIIVCAALCVIAYSVSIKDEIIRAMVLIIAMKDMDVRRVLKVLYILTLAGTVVIGLMAVFGIMGEVFTVGAYSDKLGVTYVSLGFGSSNTFAIQIWVLTVLAVYVYHKRMNLISYGAVALLGIVVYLMTGCRVELLMMLFTAFAGAIFTAFPKISESLVTYITGCVISVACLAVSVYSAAVSGWWEVQTPFQIFLNKITTGRIMSIYPFENGGGVLSNWRLFSAPDFDRYFDMGIVRLFWWYGIIPGSLCVLAIFLLYVWQYKHKDSAGFLLTLSVVIFTVLEAHFISVFLARAYVLFLIGGTWYKVLSGKKEEKTKRHIAFYIGSLSKGGAERVFVNLAKYFLSEGNDVTMITQYVHEDEYELPKGADRIISDLGPEECKGRVYNFFARIAKLHKIIRNTGADLLMTTAGKSNFMAITCSAFLPARVVVSVVADPPLEYPTRMMRFLLQTLFGDADGIIMQTARQRDFLRKGLRREAVILPNSVSPDFIRKPFFGTRKKEIYLVGRMDDNKNQAMAISAFAKGNLKDSGFRLIICGDGPDRDKLTGLICELGLKEYVELPGVVSDVSARLYDAYAFVLTSDTEGMPNTLLEAMSLGVPCISTDCPCGGPAELIKHGENGLLVKVRDTEGLKEVLVKLALDPDYAERLGQAAYDTMVFYRPENVNLIWKNYFWSVMNS